MRLKERVLVISGAVLCLAGASAWAQDDDESTIRAIPDPAADLPAAVTKDLPLPAQAAEEADGRSAAGRSGERRDAGLATALAAPSPGGGGVDGLETAQAHAADAAQEALASAAEAAAGSREDFGRSHAPESLPDLAELPDLPEQAPVDLPDTPGPVVPTPGRP